MHRARRTAILPTNYTRAKMPPGYNRLGFRKSEPRPIPFVFAAMIVVGGFVIAKVLL